MADSHPPIPLQLYQSAPQSLCPSCSQTCPWHTAQRLLPKSCPRSEFLEKKTCIIKNRDTCDLTIQCQSNCQDKNKHSLYIGCMIQVCNCKTQGDMMSRAKLTACCSTNLKQLDGYKQHQTIYYDR